jgi:hypothetical protein
MKSLVVVAITVFSTCLFLFLGTVDSARAGEADLSRDMVRNLKMTDTLSGRERMQAMHKYVCGLPNNRLAALLDEIGGARFLPPVPPEKNMGRGPTGPVMVRDRRQQMRIQLQTPEGRDRLCHAAANYLLNTVR